MTIPASAETYNDLQYNKVDADEDGEYDYVEIYSCYQSAVSVDIPAEIDGLPVTYIGDEAFVGCTSLKSINIPDSVTFIYGQAFIGCTSLTSINIPDSVTCISSGTFNGCESLESITIPDSVTYIDPYAFYGCTSLESITIPDSVTYIGFRAFEGCTSLESIEIPDSVTSIVSRAFEGCTSLESITILNPYCEIDDDDQGTTINETATIYGYENSTAQAYAEKYNRKFVSLDNKPSEGNYYLGNVDGNTTINIFDAVIVAQYTVGKQTLTDEQFKAADVDHSGKVNIFDAVIIAKYTVGTPFPV